MKRLFPILYIAIIATLVAVFFSVLLFSQYLNGRVEKDSYTEIYYAPFFVLNGAIEGLEGEALQQRLEQLRSIFKYPVDLIPADSAGLTTAQRTALKNDRIISANTDNGHTLFSKSTIDGWIWSYIVRLSELESEVAVATGPLQIMKSWLTSITGTQRQSLLEEFTEQTGYPLAIGQEDTFELNDNEKSRLEKNLVVVRKPGKPGEQFFIQLNEAGEILRATVPGYPWYAAYLAPLLLACAVFSLALFSLFWLWPLWKDLQALRQASGKIAEGKLDTRVKTGRPSIIKPVLLGFNAMADSSQKMIDSQKELTDAVSHELRTPLARMKFDLEMLGESTVPADQQRHIEDMKFDINELNSLVDELLSFAREDNHSIAGDFDTLTSVQAEDWLQQQLQLAGRTNPDKHMRLEFNVQENISLNTKSMTRVVSNGLQNALRYSSDQVVLRCSITGNSYELAIDDDGPGIPQELRDTIFEPFKRTDASRNRESGGFGLGLAIVKRIAESHNGEARVEDSVLGGNRLVVRWPKVSNSGKNTMTRNAA